MSLLKLLSLYPVLCMSPADEGGAGAGAGAGEGENKQASMIDGDAIKKAATDPNDPAAVQKAADETATKTAEQPGQKMTRPDWLKEDKFWDAEKGEVKSQDMLKSFQELEKKFHNGDHKAPGKAEDYKINLNDEAKKTLFGDEKADAAADPAIKELTAWAAEHKIPQGALDSLLEKYVGIVEPEMAKMTINIDAEKAQLGKNADAVIKNQMDFVGQLYKSGHINDTMLAELQILGETAAGIKALQAIRAFYGEQPIPTNITAGDGAPTKAELSAMLNDPKYDSDADYRAKVDAAYTKHYGSQPAMSSAQNR